MASRPAVVVAPAVGLAASVGGYTFVYARGVSDLTDDPGACADCHGVREHFDGGVESTRRAVAVGDDCYTPPAVVSKYPTKASDGFEPHNRDIGERARRRGHQESAGANRRLQDDVVPDLGGRCGPCEFREVCEGWRARAGAATQDLLAEDPPCAYEPGGAAWTSTSS